MLSEEISYPEENIFSPTDVIIIVLILDSFSLSFIIVEISFSISSLKAFFFSGLLKVITLVWLKSSNLTNRIANKMIRPTTIPQTLDDLKIEQALAREALRLSFIQHKEFAVSLKGVQQERTISDTFDQKMSGETIVNMKELDLIVGSGGVLSHAPRRSQAMRMLID